MKQRFLNLSLQRKISLIYIGANILVLAVNVILMLGISAMSHQLDSVYQDNRQLKSLSDEMTVLQDSMTAYLSSKSSDSLDRYYRSEQSFRSMVEELEDYTSQIPYINMERNIKHMAAHYLELTGQTIEAKRGRNVKKYRARYDNAAVLYDYIMTYIDSLNDEQFAKNSESFNSITDSFYYFEIISIWVIIMVFLINIAIVVMLTGNIISPLKKLASLTDKVAEGNFDIELPVVRSRDEIGVVTDAFNQMVVSIREYIEQVRHSIKVEQALLEREYRMEAHLKEAQLKYLQAQINPHFLFNTLNAGAQLAMLEGADRTYDYVQNMAEFFRYNVRRDDSPVTIGEELRQINHYIYILNVRFSGEIGYEQEIDESCLNVRMPGMILQPIVENCINHGIREMEGKGRIILRVYGSEDKVCISIRDNGAGMDKDLIDGIMEGRDMTGQKSNSGNGIGLDNVIARLKLFAGDASVFQIKSRGAGMGTEFIIRIDRENSLSDNKAL